MTAKRYSEKKMLGLIFAWIKYADECLKTG